MYLTLYEQRRHLPTFTHYLMVITSQMTNEPYSLILDVSNENDRYTLLDIGTDVNDALNGSIQITEVGQYRYTVYGQNSETNLDHENAVVVGVVENGVLLILNTDVYFNADNPDIPAFTIQE